MTRDRLQALGQAAGIQQDGADQDDVHIEVGEPQSFMDDFFEQVKDIRTLIDSVQAKVEEVKKLQSEVLSAPTQDDRVKQSLDQAMADIKTTANKVRNKLKVMEQKIEQEEQSTKMNADYRIRKTQYSSLLIAYSEVMESHSEVMDLYRSKCKERLKRQLAISDPAGRNTSDDELENMLESGNPAVFTKGIIMESAEARQTLQDIEARHSDIMKLETSIKELHDMFMDMAMLVESQGEMIDRIEFNVEKSKDYVDTAVKDTKKALKYQSAARKKKICLACCLLVVLTVLVAVIVISICTSGGC